MVRAGLGVCLVPALAVYDNCCGSGGTNLYATDRPDRQTLAIVPSQYQRIELYSAFLDALWEAGSAVRMPPILPIPPFIALAVARQKHAGGT